MRLRKDQDNPYSLTFGREPARLISRNAEIDNIISNFNSDTPSSSVYLISGVRGSGKTVTMATIIDRLKADKNWIVCTLNPNRDLLESFAANLYEHPAVKPAFLKAEIKFSFMADVSIKSERPIQDVETVLKKMLAVIQKLNKKVLLAVDEAVNNENFKVFASSFQMFMMEKYPVFLIMTGLYKNIDALQNEETLTFLYRAPKYELQPLSLVAMSNDYINTMGLEQKEADDLARLTKGYSYAFQVMGYLKFSDRNAGVDALLPEFDEIMEEYSYEKIWSELTKREKEVVLVLVRSDEDKVRVKEIKDQTGLTNQSFPTYRKRLKGSGVISLTEYGYCELALPRFKEIARRWIEE